MRRDGSSWDRSRSGPKVPAQPRLQPITYAVNTMTCPGCDGFVGEGEPLYLIHEDEPLQCESCARWEERK